MAEASISVAQDELSCPICLDLLKDPVSLSCGHSYCRRCITDCWNQEDLRRVYSCPQCRHTFSPRPALAKNVLVAEMVEKLMRTRLQTADRFAGSGDVECDVCTGRKHAAVQSCLACLNSYCHTHLQQHQSFFRAKKHRLIHATARLQQMICTTHDEQLKIYCRTDQQCICYPCMMDDHKNHETVTAVEERTEKQRMLKETQRKYQEAIQKKEKKIQELTQAICSYKRSAQTAVRSSERIFTELLRSIERSRSEVAQRIRDQEKASVSRAEGFLEQLQKEISDLRRNDAELEQLSHTQDHIQFLQSFRSFSDAPEPPEGPSVSISSFCSFNPVRNAIAKLKDNHENLCKEEIVTISGRVTYIEVIPLQESKIRQELLQYYRFFTLDPNTANKHICLCARSRKATGTKAAQPYRYHVGRFQNYRQVLCRESVCGRSYWELRWSGEVGVCVSYESVRRQGYSDACRFGCNDQSWKLYCTSSSCSFHHNMEQTDLPVLSDRRIGVFVDHSAGTLSFYSVSDRPSLIHTVQTAFTQPLYPSFWMSSDSGVDLCEPADAKSDTP